MFNPNTCITTVKVITTTYPDGTSTSLDLMKPGVSLALDTLQILRERMPDAAWPAYFNIADISEMLQKHREGEIAAREKLVLRLLDDAAHEIVSVLARQALRIEMAMRRQVSGDNTIDEAAKLTDHELTQFDQAIGLVKMLNSTGDTEGVRLARPEDILDEALRIFSSLDTIGDLKAAMCCAPLTVPETRH